MTDTLREHLKRISKLPRKLEVAIDEFHDGQYSHTLRNSETERRETVPDVTPHFEGERMEQRPGRNAGILRNGKYTVELMGRGHHAH